MIIFIRHFFGFLKRENLHRIVIILLALIVISASLLAVVEPATPFHDWMWWSIVTLTTVGYGDITPDSAVGRAVGIVLMFFGIGLLGMFTATVAGIFVEKKLKKERGMGSLELEDHIILCEWNYRMQEILKELRHDPHHSDTPIALLADVDVKPVDDENLFFIQGKITEENLKRANIQTATTVVILGDDQLEADARDAMVVLATLAVESVNPSAYTIVELVNEENVRHCQRAHADEIVVGAEFSSHLIANAAVDHGITKVFSDILSSRCGNDLQKVSVPDGLAGREFLAVISSMKRDSNSIVLAVQRGEEVITNPKADFKVEKNDNLIVIASVAA